MSAEKEVKKNVIDKQGFRLNIGIIVVNERYQVLWAQRRHQHSWQFPQGGVSDGESLEEAMYRELYEELGLKREDVKILHSTPTLLKYRLPPKLVRYDRHPLCLGQKQKWYLLQLLSDDSAINLSCSEKPEFDNWIWAPFWYPLRYVISFKREVYRKALKYFAEQLFVDKIPAHLKPRHENFMVSIRSDKKY